MGDWCWVLEYGVVFGLSVVVGGSGCGYKAGVSVLERSVGLGLCRGVLV